MQPVAPLDKNCVTKMRESRKQLITLARTLDLDPKKAAEDLVGRYMLDLHELMEIRMNPSRNI